MPAQKSQNRTNDDKKFWKFQATKAFGLGASLHVWAQHVCNAIEQDKILLWRDPWNWNYCTDDYAMYGFSYDQRSCFFNNETAAVASSSSSLQSPPSANSRSGSGSIRTSNNGDDGTADVDVGERDGDDDLGGDELTTVTNLTLLEGLIPTDPKDSRILRNTGINRWGIPKYACPNVMNRLNVTLSEFRAGAVEWLFSSVHDRVIVEALRQVNETFGKDGLPDPEDMVTVHVRWGDKSSEIDLVPIDEYINATKEITANRRRNSRRHNLPTTTAETNGSSSTSSSSRYAPLHVYLATEDQDAIEQFKAKAPPDWKIYTSGPTTPREDNSMTKFASGRAALESLGALLLSLESNYYVLTLASNWSMLINELRLNVLNPRCGSCTKMVNITGERW